MVDKSITDNLISRKECFYVYLWVQFDLCFPYPPKQKCIFFISVIYLKCDKKFHAMCAVLNGNFLDYKKNNKGKDVIHSYCEEHSKEEIL